MAVELLDLPPTLSSPARKLSLGQRMKADIGMVFLHQMNKEKGVSIFLTSHDLDDIDEICDDAIVLSKGKLFYDFCRKFF